MDNPNRVRVEPTKELFVYILTRDIAHHAAIIELLDNSVDGAHRVAKDTDKLSDYKVEIDFNSNKFCISDNCGGIPLQVAREYAFRFGRAEGMKSVPGSIGQFGVGMKRALFSFGRRYVIESATKEDWFRLEIDRDEWMKDKESWDFQMAEFGNNDAGKPIGTRIEVTDLLEESGTQFELDRFRTRLENEIRQKHGLFIGKGLVVRVKGTAIPSQQWRLISDEQFVPGYSKSRYNAKGAAVDARIYSGVYRSSPTDAGWYIICNGRLVLSADKSEKTGWGWHAAEADAAPETPRYHNQFARFRGYAMFDSDDAARLPWNTTKTDVDPDDSIWLDAREKMASEMRPVIDFLNLLDAETEQPDAERPLTAALGRARMVPIAEIKEVRAFSFPKNPQKPGPKMVSIQFKKEKTRVDELQEAMGTASARETGDAAFEDAYQYYVDEENE